MVKASKVLKLKDSNNLALEFEQPQINTFYHVQKTFKLSFFHLFLSSFSVVSLSVLTQNLVILFTSLWKEFWDPWVAPNKMLKVKTYELKTYS